jgi:hypothetical protein
MIGMTHPNPDLIVPIRDRRRGKRILTLKNVRNAALITAGLVVTFFVVAEIRQPKTKDDYGRLFGQQVAAPTPEVKPTQQIVTEGSIPDQDHADPMLLSAAAREQYLGVTTDTALVPTATGTTEPVQPRTTLTNSKHVAIVGDANGVAISTSTQKRETLGGGIFKPPQ